MMYEKLLQRLYIFQIKSTRYRKNRRWFKRGANPTIPRR